MLLCSIPVASTSDLKAHKHSKWDYLKSTIRSRPYIIVESNKTNPLLSTSGEDKLSCICKKPLTVPYLGWVAIRLAERKRGTIDILSTCWLLFCYCIPKYTPYWWWHSVWLWRSDHMIQHS